MADRAVPEECFARRDKAPKFRYLSTGTKFSTGTAVRVDDHGRTGTGTAQWLEVPRYRYFEVPNVYRKYLKVSLWSTLKYFKVHTKFLKVELEVESTSKYEVLRVSTVVKYQFQPFTKFIFILHVPSGSSKYRSTWYQLQSKCHKVLFKKCTGNCKRPKFSSTK